MEPANRKLIRPSFNEAKAEVKKEAPAKKAHAKKHAAKKHHHSTKAVAQKKDKPKTIAKSAPKTASDDPLLGL